MKENLLCHCALLSFPCCPLIKSFLQQDYWASYLFLQGPPKALSVSSSWLQLFSRDSMCTLSDIGKFPQARLESQSSYIHVCLWTWFRNYMNFLERLGTRCHSWTPRANSLCIFVFFGLDRIPFAATMLARTRQVVKTYKSLHLISLWTVFLAMFWLAVWIFGVSGAVSLPYGGWYAALLVISLAWSMEVLRNIVYVTVAGVVGTYYYEVHPHHRGILQF